MVGVRERKNGGSEKEKKNGGGVGERRGRLGESGDGGKDENGSMGKIEL